MVGNGSGETWRSTWLVRVSVLAVLASMVPLACGDAGDANIFRPKQGAGGEGATGNAGTGASLGGGSAMDSGGSAMDGGGPSMDSGGATAEGGAGPSVGGQGGDECVPSAIDCTSADDNDCSGMPDNTECTGCTRADDSEAAFDDTEACFTAPPPATATGVCATGTRTCVATADKTALEWGPCEGESGPTSETDSCDPDDNGDENCDGTARAGCPCKPGDPAMSCGSCGGTQECTDDFEWGPCSKPTPANLGDACDAGCGTIQCSGQCSTSGHGGDCGSCGGKVQCNGSCSVGTPGNYGQACDAGCGTIQCSGQCSTSGHGGACGSCGGVVQCNGQCSVGTPGNLGQSCDAGCGTIQCSGQCSTSGHGGDCGSCGGKVQCDNQCSVGTPWNLGATCNQCGSGHVDCGGGCNSTCDVNYNGGNVEAGWGWCAAYKYGTSAPVYCPGGTSPVYCSMGWSAGFWGDVYDEGDGTTRIYNGKGDIDALWDGSGGCYLYIRAFNCDATTAYPIAVCRG